MIITFKQKALEAFHREGKSKGIQQAHATRLRKILQFLESSTTVLDMNIPGLRLHQLEPKTDGQWSVMIDANYRLVFKFDAGNAYAVEVIDYH